MFNHIRCHQHQFQVQMCHLYLNVKLWTEYFYLKSLLKTILVLWWCCLGAGYMKVPYQNNATIPICGQNVRCQKVQLWQLLRATAAGNIVKRAATGKHLQWRLPLVNPPFLLLLILKPPVFTLSISQLFFLTFSLSLLSFLPILFLLPFYPFVPSPPSLLRLCANDYMPLSSQHKQPLVMFLPVYWCLCHVLVGVFIPVFTVIWGTG